MNLYEITHQYRGTTLPRLVRKQIKSLDEETLLQAIRGTYENFPTEFRPQIDSYTLAYPEKWFGPYILTADLSDIFSSAIQDIRAMVEKSGMSLNDDQIFDIFNLIVMRLSFFAHSKPGLRKMLGIKKGWFS